MMPEVTVNGIQDGSLEQYLESAWGDLHSSSVKKRTEAFQNCAIKLTNGSTTLLLLGSTNWTIDHSAPVASTLFRIITPTYSLCVDRSSRAAIQRCLRILVQTDTVTKQIAAFLEDESQKSGLAPANAFVLVEWCSTILQEIRSTSQWQELGLRTITCLAKALHKCVESGKATVHQSALVLARRGIRKVIKKPMPFKAEIIETSVSLLCTPAPTPSAWYATLLGCFGGVCARDEEARDILSKHKAQYYMFYQREIVGSKVPIPPHVAEGLHDFFFNFSTQEDLQDKIVPALEKGLLRSPETVLDGLITTLCHSMPDQVDFSSILQLNLMKPLLSNVKSSNASIRRGAVQAFSAIISRCQDSGRILQVGKEIALPLASGKLASAEQRAIYADLLAMLPCSKDLYDAVAPILSTALAKEQNDVAIESMARAIIHNFKCALQWENKPDKALLQAFAIGLSNKKPTIKKIWSIQLSQMLLDICSTGNFSKSVSCITRSCRADFSCPRTAMFPMSSDIASSMFFFWVNDANLRFQSGRSGGRGCGTSPNFSLARSHHKPIYC